MLGRQRVRRAAVALKCDEACLKSYCTVLEAETPISKCFELYSRRRLHSNLDRMTPEQPYFNTLP